MSWKETESFRKKCELANEYMMKGDKLGATLVIRSIAERYNCGYKAALNSVKEYVQENL
jgi:hypothetical protein